MEWARDGGAFIPSLLNWIEQRRWHDRPLQKQSLDVLREKIAAL
jgi:hypothetical protein